MENVFTNNRFYPQNFILYKSGIEDSIIRQISDSAENIAPYSFDAEVLYFHFIMHYQPPYTNFTELKRLQSEAIKHTRFKDEYHGFIAIDISEWKNHFDDEFFAIMLTFLSDMSDSWKYIFLLDDERSIPDLTVLIQKTVPSMRTVELNSTEIPKSGFAEALIDEICISHKKDFSSYAKKLLLSVFRNKVHNNDNEIANIAKDISVYFSDETHITFLMIKEYLLNEFTYMNSFMTKEELMILRKKITEKEVTI